MGKLLLILVFAHLFKKTSLWTRSVFFILPHHVVNAFLLAFLGCKVLEVGDYAFQVFTFVHFVFKTLKHKEITCNLTFKI